jgi:hypothetical protein
MLSDLTILISALPVLGEPLTVNKSERVILQIKQNINDIKEMKWFKCDIDGKLISIQPDNNRYHGGTHDRTGSAEISMVKSLNIKCILQSTI